MRIDAIDVYHVAMPLIEPWRTAYGEDATVESILVRFESDGLAGWAESAAQAAPNYSSEWAGGAFALIVRHLAPALVGQDVTSGQALQERLAHFRGNSFAKAALDNAWWVLEAMRQGLPLHRLLGANRDAVPVGADFGVDDGIPRLLERIGQAVADGFPRIKLKFRPGWELNMLRAVRREFPTHTIHIDMNSGYRLDEHFELLCRLDDFQLAMIEQPLAHDDLLDHARLQQVLRTPICLDESISSPQKALLAIDLGSCRYVNIKPGRVGGLTPALAIHDACRAAKIPCWVGGMLESAIGARIAAAVAMLDNCTYPADIFPSSRFYTRDLAEPPLLLTRDEAGVPHVALSAEPGIATAPDPQRLARATLAHVRLA